MALIALCGGIGSGKSVVARILKEVMGFPVLDSDRLARQLMNSDAQLKQSLIAAFGPEVYDVDGALNANRLAAVVFDDDECRDRLNGIVHPVVCDAIVRWARQHRVAFVESALPRTAGLRDKADRVWMVTAPDELRCRRVMQRNNMTADQVMQRIVAQQADATPDSDDLLLVNDETVPLLPQLLAAVQSMNIN